MLWLDRWRKFTRGDETARQERESGRFIVGERTLTYRLGKSSWEVTPEEILVVGESTNEMGPLADDYWLCIVVATDGWLEGSFYAVGRDEAEDWLSTKLGTKLELRLLNSTSLQSRVMWPPALEGRPLFEYLEPPPRTRVGALLRKLGIGPFSTLSRMHPDVLQWISSKMRHGSARDQTGDA